MTEETVVTQTGDEGAVERLAREARRAAEVPEELLRRIRPLVLRWALLRTGDEDQAEDVAQEVLVRVVRSLGSWDGRGRFTTWLYRVVANAAQDRGRRRSREAAGRLRLARRGTLRNPLTAPEGSRVAALLEVLLDELTPHQRMAFDLVDLQGVPGPEAAAMHEMNESTFRVHLARARAAVRKAIQDGRTW